MRIACVQDAVVFANPTANGPFNFLRPEDERTEDDPTYPVMQQDSDGNPVLVVNTEQLYRYVAADRHLSSLVHNRKPAPADLVEIGVPVDLRHSGSLHGSQASMVLGQRATGPRWAAPSRQIRVAAQFTELLGGKHESSTLSPFVS